MSSTEYNDSDLASILARAEQISEESQSILQLRPEMAPVVEAAAESGLSREAVLQALHERFLVTSSLPEVGQLVYAASEDGHAYVAELVSVEGQWAMVKFLTGSQARVSAEQVQPFSLIPGQKIQCRASGQQIWMDGRLASYNELGRSATISVWGSQQSVSLELIRLPIAVNTKPLEMNPWLAKVIGLVAVGSTAIGFLIGMLVNR